MDPTVLIYFAILCVALFLFYRDIFPFEISALIVLSLLVSSGIVPQREAFASFGNESLVMIGSLFVIVAGLHKTGIIELVEEQLLHFGGFSRSLGFAGLLIVVAFLSAFVSNTIITAISVPIVVAMAHRYGDSPRPWLLPMAYAAMLGGTNTLIGSSTNIVASSIITEHGFAPFSLFSITHLGLPVTLVGLGFLSFFGYRLLDNKKPVPADTVEVKYDIRAYTAEVLVLPDSPLCNCQLIETNLFREADITLLGVIREDYPLLYPRATMVIRPNDRLIVEGDLQKLTDITAKYCLRYQAEKLGRKRRGLKRRTVTKSILEFHEVLVSSTSSLRNQTPAQAALRSRYRMSIIAVNREGVTIRQKLSELQLQAGDLLVLQHTGLNFNEAIDLLGLVPLKMVQHDRSRLKRAPLAAAIFLGTLVLGSIFDGRLALVCLVGAILMVVTKILKTEEMYRAIDWKILLFIGAVLCLGRGMVNSGAAEFLGTGLSQALVGHSPIYAIAAFTMMTMVFTTLISNQATVAVFLPIAITTAEYLHFSPLPLVYAITVSASCNFIAPFEAPYMLVYAPGDYRVRDFFRVGVFLNIISMILIILLTSIYWDI